MHVHAVEVHFSRKVQVQQFEPAEAHITFHASFGEDETGYADAANSLMAQAREITHAGLKGQTGQTSATVTPTVKSSSAPATKSGSDDVPGEPAPAKSSSDDVPGDDKPQEAPKRRGRPPKAESKAKAESKPKSDDIPDEPAPAASDVPGDDEPAPAASDVPGDDEDDEFAGLVGEESPEPISAAELQAFVAEMVQSKKITIPAVKQVMADEFGVSRTSEVSESQRPVLKKRITELATG